MPQNIELNEAASTYHPMPRRISRNYVVLLCALIFISGYMFSTWFLTIYRWGDQEHYDSFWRAVAWTPYWRWESLQLQYLSSAEPLYRVIIGLGTRTELDRITYLSLWNGVLLAAIGYALIKNRSSILFAILVFTNYYILVLLGPAERLKFAYVFLILAYCFQATRWKIASSIMSIFCHTQAIAQFISASIYFVAVNYKEIASKRINLFALVTIVPVIIVLSTYYLLTSSGDVIAQKAEFYGDESQGILEIIQWAMILVCGTVVFDKRLQFFVGMLPMGILTSLYGSRINVATLAFFCALSLIQRRTGHPLVLAVMAYMSFKSIGFMMNVLKTGQGF